MRSENLLELLQRSIARLLKNDGFEGGQPFRPTQKQALQAYSRYLSSTSLNVEEKLKGFFEIPTGVGKTAVFVGIVGMCHLIAQEDGERLKSAIVVPTTQLLTQTQGSFISFAPSTSGHIGLYGDSHKNLRMPLTIMTYDSWSALTEQNKIGSHNIDILISDEAHRGTSERRVENISAAFNAQTIQLAFTATAHFDEEKSVQSSHQREIFYKAIRDAVLEDELASYIQSQKAVIRVEPTAFMKSDDYKNATKEEKTDYRKKIRQKAWNEFAIKAYRDGIDERTKDLLTDNQASFFVDSIAQADKLERMLNADPELQRRAKEGGYEGVALAIHSKITGGLSSGQQARFNAYMAGKYMAVIGDEKFKEGFDHPPMKTVFDSAHSSLVDKAQILGRGARKWWNDKKSRWEGLTFLDTVIYIGSEDPDEDALFRSQALRKAVAAKDILEESYVIGPTAPILRNAKNAGSGLGADGYSLFSDDENVEHYSSIEDIHSLESEISKLRKEDWVEITDEIQQLLLSEKARTSTAIFALLNSASDILEDFSVHAARHWFSGHTNSANKRDLDFVIDAYSKLPNKAPFHENRIPLTDEIRELLKSERSRTGVAPTALLANSGALPEGLRWQTIIKWMSGRAKSVNEEHLEYVLNLWEKCPSKNVPNLEVDSDRQKSDSQISVKSLSEDFTKRSRFAGRLVVTEEMRQIARDFRESTGIGQFTLLTHADNVPEDLNHRIVEKLLSGRLKTIAKEHWEFTISAWKSIEEGEEKSKRTKPKLRKGYIHIDEEVRKRLLLLSEKTGLMPKGLISKAGEIPEGLKYFNIKDWLSGKAESAKAEYLEWAIKEWERHLNPSTGFSKMSPIP